MIRRTTRQRAVAAIATVILTTALASCSGDGDGDSGSADASSASESSSPDSPEGEASDAGQTGESIDKDAFIARVGSVEPTPYTAAMVVDGGGVTIDADALVDPTREPPAMSIEMNTPQLKGSISVIDVDGDVYTQIPGVMPGGKWLKSDKPADGADVPNPDPSANLDNFADGITDVSFIGDETIDGTDTEHYQLTIDSAQIDDPSQVSDGNVPDTLMYDVWLDSDDRTRKFLIDLGGNGTVEAVLSGYGEPVSISAPAASDLIKFPIG